MQIAKELEHLPKINISKIQPLQGNLKDLNEQDYQKLKKRLEKGFKYPFYVWIDNGDHFTLDGHQRTRCILKEYGDVEVPYIEVQAKNKTEAKKEILAISSQYGKVTKEGFDEFTADFEEFDFEEIKMETDFEKYTDPDIDFDNIQSNENRTTEDKVQNVVCPSCNHNFSI